MVGASLAVALAGLPGGGLNIGYEAVERHAHGPRASHTALRWLGADGSVKQLACGSINLHGNFFGKRFDIKGADGEPVQTGCVGLGIERWVLAAFTQHGFDERRWPEAIRKKIFA